MIGHYDYEAPPRLVPQDFDVRVTERGDVALFYRLGVDAPFARARGIRLGGRLELMLEGGGRMIVGWLSSRTEQAARRRGSILLFGVDAEGRTLAAAEVSIFGQSQEDGSHEVAPRRVSAAAAALARAPLTGSRRQAAAKV